MLSATTNTIRTSVASYNELFSYPLHPSPGEEEREEGEEREVDGAIHCNLTSTSSMGFSLSLDWLLGTFMNNLLNILIILCVVVGVTLGISLRNVWSYQELTKIYYLEFPGRLLLHMLKLLSMPLIITSLIRALGNMERSMNKLGLAALTYYLLSSLCASLIGLVMALTLRPGSSGTLRSVEVSDGERTLSIASTLVDFASQLIPNNIVTASFQKWKTVFEPFTFIEFDEKSQKNISITVDKPRMVAVSGTNALGLMVVASAVGIIIARMGETATPFKKFVAAVNDLVMIGITLVIWYAPIGILFLLASKFVSVREIDNLWTDMVWYIGTVFWGLFIHGFVALPLILFFLGRRNPFSFLYGQLSCLFTAFGTSSSYATLPKTLSCLITENYVNKHIVGLVAPVGATINMDGGAVHHTISALYVAQLNGIPLSLGHIALICFTAVMASSGAAGVPNAGLMALHVVLSSAGLPTSDVGLIVSVEWFIDRFKTVINVWGDAICAGVLDYYFSDSFKDSQEENPNGSGGTNGEYNRKPGHSMQTQTSNKSYRTSVYSIELPASNSKANILTLPAPLTNR